MTKKICCIVLLLATSYTYATPSMPSSSTVSESPQKVSEHKDPAPQYDQRGTKNNPIVVETLETESDIAEKKQFSKDKKAESEVNSEIRTYTGLLVVVGLAQAFLFLWQLALIRRSMKDTADSAKAAKTAAEAAMRQSDGSILALRAYIKASPALPGLEFPESTDGFTEHVTCNMEIRNYGQTPARVTDVITIFRMIKPGEKLPVIPDYRREDEDVSPFPGHMLGRDDCFYNGHGLVEKKGTISDAIKAGNLRIIVFGYVDYLDVFDQRHRTGFGREFVPGVENRAFYRDDELFSKRCNLMFMSNPGYNYDQKRLQGEGTDW